jgi:hypothetical protein
VTFDRDCLEHHLHDFLRTRQPFGTIADAQDEHLMMLIKLAPHEVGDDSKDQACLARAAGPDDMHALRGQTVGERPHQRDFGSVVTGQPELASAHVDSCTPLIGSGIIEDARVVDVLEAHLGGRSGLIS